jgi:hypothetical protein
LCDCLLDSERRGIAGVVLASLSVAAILAQQAFMRRQALAALGASAVGSLWCAPCRAGEVEAVLAVTANRHQSASSVKAHKAPLRSTARAAHAEVEFDDVGLSAGPSARVSAVYVGQDGAARHVPGVVPGDEDEATPVSSQSDQPQLRSGRGEIRRGSLLSAQPETPLSVPSSPAPAPARVSVGPLTRRYSLRNAQSISASPALPAMGPLPGAQPAGRLAPLQPRTLPASDFTLASQTSPPS